MRRSNANPLIFQCLKMNFANGVAIHGKSTTIDLIRCYDYCTLPKSKTTGLYALKATSLRFCRSQRAACIHGIQSLDISSRQASPLTKHHIHLAHFSRRNGAIVPLRRLDRVTKDRSSRNTRDWRRLLVDRLPALIQGNTQGRRAVMHDALKIVAAIVHVG